MMRTIIEAYDLGGLSIQQILGLQKEQEREIIDVDYVDISDQENPNDATPPQISDTNESTRLLK